MFAARTIVERPEEIETLLYDNYVQDANPSFRHGEAWSRFLKQLRIKNSQIVEQMVSGTKKRVTFKKAKKYVKM
jgi:hypothetical protein